jgi:glycosyltransferase involved in cell wall biosynthesis
VVQGRTLRTADAVIYPSTASRVLIASQVGSVWERSAVVPHGVERRFVRPPRPQRPISAYSEERPYRLLYVSMIDVYKHQWHVAEAVAALRARQLPVTLDLVGPAYGPALRRLQRALRRTDPAGTSIRYLGPAAFSEMHTVYHQADAFVFASTCETFALPVLEAMTAGLPIACSNRPPMSEMLGEGAVFFNPEEPRDITRVLQQMILSSQERERLASVAFARAKDYSWGQCAAGTFGVLAAAAAPRSNGPAETRGGKGADRLTRCEGESNDY